MDIKRITNLDACLKLLDEDGPGSFEGYASTFKNWDRVGERPAPGAFRNLKEFKRDGFIAWGHDWNEPVAIVTEAKEDEHGILIKCTFHGTPKAQEYRQIVAERLAKGKSMGLSIGYRVHDCKRVEGGVLLTDIELYEVSLVTVPANPKATVSAIKSGLPDGLSMDDAYETTLAVVEGLTSRVQSLSELRAEEGRALSQKHRDRVKAVCDALLALTPEPEPETPPMDMTALHLRALALRASALTVPQE